MHYRQFVTLGRDNLDEQTSSEAREHALDWLESVGLDLQVGAFEGGWVERFIIGGRWSGILSEAKMETSYFDTMRAITTSKEYRRPYAQWGFRYDEIKLYAKEFQEEWKRLGGTGPSPYLRDEFRQLGYADDAMLVDADLYNQILRRYEGWTQSPDNTFCDRDGDIAYSGFIGTKWLVVVDIVEKHRMEWNRDLSVSI